MLKVTMILDNKFASNMTPEGFVKQYYLTDLAIEDLVGFNVVQADNLITRGEE